MALPAESSRRLKEVAMKVVTVSQMRDLDHRAQAECSIPEMILMENAGFAACQVLSRYMGVRGRRYAVFCGPGNNGGDGLVVARHLHAMGAEVQVFLVLGEEKFKGAARANLEMVKKIPIKINLKPAPSIVKKEIAPCHIIVDALLGIGVDREIAGPLGDVIEVINESEKKVLSLDIPSGINGDNGAIMGKAVKADFTVTFGLPKVGNLLYPGYNQGGELRVSFLSMPPSLLEDPSLLIEVNDYVKLPPRPADAHKGMFGKALFIAGSSFYYGAPFFSSYSFLRAGGGYAYLAAPQSVIGVVAQKGAEVVFLPQEETAAGNIALSNIPRLLTTLEKVDMVVLGPGLSLADEARRLVKELTAVIDKPLIIDGDGITALAGERDLIRNRPAPTILTPHLGEMVRLSGKTMGQLKENSIAHLQETAGELNAYIVLKGAHSLIGTPNGKVFINLSGNSGMATAGSGDVLTGTIAAMMGLGLPIEEAVRKGVFIHGFAGDLAAAEKGKDGMTAGDILDYLPCAMKYDREGSKEQYGIPVL